MRLLTLLIFLLATVYAKEFTVATYNVENLFDLKNDGTEYKEYIPHTKYWHKQTLEIKLSNISKVINDLDSDIIALQEVESQNALNLLLQKLPQYKFKAFLKSQESAVGVALLSKFKIINTDKIKIDGYDRYSRPILMAEVLVENKKLKVYVNHWRSKRAAENERIKYAVSLQNKLSKLNSDVDYILLGDFNSNYNEYKTFKKDKKLNNTYGLTGINHILNTLENEKLVLENNLKNKTHYNLWLELPRYERFSSKFKGSNNTPDNILLPASLYDNKHVSYVDNSFKVFKPSYLYKNGKINRWNRYKGYSDHLPLVATFTTQKMNYKKSKKKINKIEQLYNLEHIDNPVKLGNVVVVYKNSNSAILKNINGRAIYAYKCANDLKVGNIYNLTINQIDNYHGLLEIKQISSAVKTGEYEKYKELYKDATKIDIFNHLYANEIITNVEGRFIKNYLYLKNGKKIKLYFPRNFTKPKNNSKITIVHGHLGSYKGKVQIIIHKQSDIKKD